MIHTIVWFSKVNTKAQHTLHNSFHNKRLNCIEVGGCIIYWGNTKG